MADYQWRVIYKDLEVLCEVDPFNGHVNKWSDALAITKNHGGILKVGWYNNDKSVEVLINDGREPIIFRRNYIIRKNNVETREVAHYIGYIEKDGVKYMSQISDSNILIGVED
jgi:hypothetical protein